MHKTKPYQSTFVDAEEVELNMQRKVDSRNKINADYTNVNGRMIKLLS